MRIFHYHLKKCAGTTMNSWLDTLTSAARVQNLAWREGGGDAAYAGRPLNDTALYGHNLFHWSDVVHSHAPIRAQARPGTFCFTVLRAPAARLISQFADWRRLTRADFAAHDAEEQACMTAAQHMSLSEFLAGLAQGLGRVMFDNYLTRALAASRMGDEALLHPDAQALLPTALRALHEDFHFIGIAEEFELSRNALCALLGLPPAACARVHNQSEPEHKDGLALSEADAAVYTGQDRILYDAARALFDERYRAPAEAYDLWAFEQRHAAPLLARLQAAGVAGAAKYSVRDAFYGAWLHDRDGGCHDRHAVWTVSGRRARIYLPVPEGVKLEILLWVRGYAEEAQRNALRIWIDGIARCPRSEAAEDYAELLVIPWQAARSFVRLEIEVPDAGAVNPLDTRPRGVCFDAYGWRPVPGAPNPAARAGLFRASSDASHAGT